ncbi:MAG TPA: glycosyltransferase family 2 protein [Gemmatimonadaceae bacterium]|nr:glycosyltransferase family 2 protein [Gemmatimonadaceae bacterium]
MTLAHGGKADISVLVPARDEAGNLELFVSECARALAPRSVAYEVVIVDDGSTDDSPAILSKLAATNPFLRTARHRSGRGIAAALRTAAEHATGRVFVFYPADMQFKPEDIPRLAEPVLAGETDIMTGFKEGKYDKAFVSGIYNGLSRRLFRVGVRDLNNVKAYTREVMNIVPDRPDWHRYMVVVAAAQGFSVQEIPVTVYPRHAGRSKFGLSRIPIGVLDMLSVWFELRFGQKPLLLFGLLGAGLFAIGVLAGLTALAMLLIYDVGTRAVWTVVQTCLVLGSVFFATGLLGEQIAAQRAELREMRRRFDTAKEREQERANAGDRGAGGAP